MGNKHSKKDKKDTKTPRTNNNHDKVNNTVNAKKIYDDFFVVNPEDTNKNSNTTKNNSNNNSSSNTYSYNNSSSNTYSYNNSTDNKSYQQPVKKELSRPKSAVPLSIDEDFKNYCNKSQIIDEDGMVKIGQDLGIDIYTDMFFPYFLYKCKAKKLEEITLNEYKTGLNFFYIKSIKSLPKNKITAFKNDIASKDFEDFFKYLFQINQAKSKSVAYEIVEVYFKELFANQYPFVNNFLTFLKEKKNSMGLNKDQWVSFYDLLKYLGKTKKFEDSYNMNEAWPVLFDDFYLYYCEIKKIKPRIPEQENDYSGY